MNAFVIVLALAATASAGVVHGGLAVHSAVVPAAVSYQHVSKVVTPAVAVAAVPALGYGYGQVAHVGIAGVPVGLGAYGGLGYGYGGLIGAPLGVSTLGYGVAPLGVAHHGLAGGILLK